MFSASVVFVCNVTLMKITSHHLITSCRNQLIPEGSHTSCWLTNRICTSTACVYCVCTGMAWFPQPAGDSDHLCFVSAGTTRQLRTGLRNTPCDPPSHHLLLEINRFFFPCGLSSAICSHYFVPFSTLMLLNPSFALFSAFWRAAKQKPQTRVDSLLKPTEERTVTINKTAGENEYIII